VHLTLGILRKSQAVFYALAFFWLDGFAVPAPAQVTQTVGQPLALNLLRGFQNWLSFKLAFESSKSGFRFLAKFWFRKN